MIKKIFIALILVFCTYLGANIFLFSSFYVPTSSMLPTLKPGNYIWVDKTRLGARLLNVFNEDSSILSSYRRIKGFDSVRRNDILVFNNPIIFGQEHIRFKVNEYMVKRCVALPGDTFSIIAGRMFTNGDKVGVPYSAFCVKQAYKESYKSHNKHIRWDALGNWSIVDWGPVILPKKGRAIEITRNNYLFYKPFIEFETKKEIQRAGSTIYLDDQCINEYTFLNNGYFMIGDNAVASFDSRYWGALPEQFIVGRVVTIFD